jgi:hypothetical protein
MTAKIGPTKLFRNRISGDRFLAAEKPNGDVYYAQLDENNNPINAGNQFPKNEYNELLNNLEMELDENAGKVVSSVVDGNSTSFVIGPSS